MIPRKNEHILTIMTTFIKAKLNKADGQMIIDKYRVAAHTILHNIISGKKFDVFNCIRNHHTEFEIGRTTLTILN